MHTLRLAAVLAALLVASTAACADTPAGWTSDGPDTAKACDTRIVAPRLAVEVLIPSIVAESESWCDHSPASHVVTIWIERLGPDGWAPFIPPNSEPSTSCRDVPRAGHNTTCQHLALGCLDGSYRTRAMVQGTGPTGEAFGFDLPEAPSAVLTCPNPWKERS